MVAQPGEADVGGDAVQPGPQGASLGLELIEGAPGAEEGVLHQSLRVVQGAKHPVAVSQQLVAKRPRRQANELLPLGFVHAWQRLQVDVLHAATSTGTGATAT